MQKNPQSPRRASVDGFIPRRPRGTQLNGPHRHTLSDTRRPSSRQGIEFHEKWSPDDDSTLQIEAQPLAADKRPRRRNPLARLLFWRRKSQPPLTRRQKIKRVVLAVLMLLVLIGGFLGWKFLLNAGRIFNGNVLGLFDNTRLRGEDEGRVNILLAGTSEDDPDHGGADLTDSIMLVSLDVRNNTAFTASIPRDLWVDYGRACSSGYQGKINVLYQCGVDTKFNEDGYASGGMGLLQKTVSQSLGLPIHYYAKINYSAFKQAVDAVGGIDITIDSQDPRGVYDPNIQPKDGGALRLSNGLQKLNGKTALSLARSRNSAGGYGMSRGDFDRTNYQRAMLVALKDKALSAGTLVNPAKLGGLLDAAGKNVKTDFKTNELRRLYELSKLIKNQNITSIDLTSEEISLLTTGSYSGQSIVQPTAGLNDFSQIKAYFKKLTSRNPVVREAASVVVLNGSGSEGLAQRRAAELTAKELKVTAVGNGSARRSSLIIDKSKGKKSATKALLEKTFGVSATTQSAKYPEVAGYEADFIVIIGTAAAGSQN